MHSSSRMRKRTTSVTGSTHNGPESIFTHTFHTPRVGVCSFIRSSGTALDLLIPPVYIMYVVGLGILPQNVLPICLGGERRRS